MNQHQNLQFAYKRFKSCKKGRILRLVLSPSFLHFPAFMRFLDVTIVGNHTKNPETCHTHHNGPTHPSQSLFKLYFESKLIVCYAFIIFKKMYIYHKHDTLFKNLNLQKRLDLCGTITLQLELRKHSYISNMASFLSLHECWTALVNPRTYTKRKNCKQNFTGKNKAPNDEAKVQTRLFKQFMSFSIMSSYLFQNHSLQFYFRENGITST